ncbi:MAG: hypothetical protein HRU38_17030, partial [Saccharospirillaceae bacterium]|nr:hypothetical protein [Pseudomonadales bacterium]NRB80342.1 hypothetical protein [Saccharospirillaceae bacterium]
MSASIIGGAQLGLLDSTLATLGRNDQTAKSGQQEGGVFVNAAKGNLVYSTRDAFLASSGEDFLLNRTYNSQTDDWRLSSAVNVEEESDGSLVRVVYGDGTKKEFNFNDDSSPKTFTTTDGAGAYETITKESDGSWSLITADQSTWVFDDQGRITSKTDTNGLAISYQYTDGKLSKIFDGIGNDIDHTISFNYVGVLLMSVSSSNEEIGTLVSYTYDNDQRLDTTTDQRGHVTSYEYTAEGLLKKITYPQQQITINAQGQSVEENFAERSVEFTYTFVTQDGKNVPVVSSYKDAQDNVTTFRYEDINQLDVNSVDATGSLPEGVENWVAKIYPTSSVGTQVIYDNTVWELLWYAHASDTPEDNGIYGGPWLKISDLPPTNEEASINFSSLSWVTGTENARTQVIDALGNKRATSNDQEYKDWRSANGYYTQYDQNIVGDALESQELGKERILATHSMIYATDTNGNIVEVVDQNGYHTVYTYDSNDNLKSKLDSQGWAITRSDTSEMRALRAELGFSDVLLSSLTETEKQALTEELTALYTSDYEYDLKGNLEKFTDNDGSVTTYTYTDFNKIETQTSAVGHALTTSNDSYYKELRKSLNSNPGFISSEPLPITIVDDLSEDQVETILAFYTTTFTYKTDDSQLLDYTSTAGGDRTDYKYYSEGETGGDIGQIKQEIKKVTNSEGVLVEQITQYTYDDLGQVESIKQALDSEESSTTLFVYDVYGNLRTTTDGNGGETTMNYDADHRLVSLEDTKGNITTYVYDAVGNALATTDTAGNEVRRLFDTNNRLMSETQIANTSAETDRVSSYTYDVYGNVKSMTNAEGHTTNYEYDIANRLVKVISALVKGENNSQVRYETTYGYDGEGRQIWINDNRDYVTRLIYDEEGLLVKSINAEGHETQIQYDDNGNQVKIMSGTQLIGTEKENKIQITQFIYDEENQLVTQTNAEGIKTQFTYDEVGNMTTQTLIGNQGGEIKTEFVYDLKNRVVTEILPETENVISGGLQQASRAYTYDANNNQLTVRDENGTNTEFYYDSNNNQILMRAKHLEDTVVGDITTQNWVYTQFKYDDLNRQTEVKLNVKFNHDESGNPIFKLEDGAFVESDLPAQWDSTKSYLNDVHEQVVYNGSIWRSESSSINEEPNLNGNNPYWKLISEEGELIDGVDNSESEVTRYRYNEFGNLIEQVSALGHKMMYSNEEMYQLKRMELGFEENALELDANKLIDIRANYTTAFKYNKLAQMIKQTQGAKANGDAFGDTKMTSFDYDALGRIEIEQNEDWGKVTRTFDGNGNAINEQFSANDKNKVVSTYDSMNRLDTQTKFIKIDKVNQPDNEHDNNYPLTTRNEYDSFNNLLGTIKNEGVEYLNVNGVLQNMEISTRVEYDNLNRITDVFNEQDHNTHIEYDEFGRKWKVTDGRGAATQTIFDARDRVIRVIDALTQETKFEYDPVGNQLIVQDARGNNVEFEYDLQNRVAQTSQLVDGEIRVSKMVYDDFGRQTQAVIASESNDEVITNFIYDAVGQLIKVVDENNEIIKHSYDILGNKLSTIDQNGNETVWTYDGLSRITKVTDADNKETQFADFDADNLQKNLTIIDANGNKTTFLYDLTGSVLTTTATAETTKSKPETIRITYDKLGRQSQIFNTIEGVDTLAQTINYYDDGLVKSKTDAMGFVTTYRYDENNNMVEQEDALNHITKYSYDALNRVSTITDAENNITEYKYDESGNRVQVIVGGVVQQTSIFNQANEIKYQVDGEGYVTEFSYTAAGKIETQITYKPIIAKIPKIVEDASTKFDQWIPDDLSGVEIKSENSFIYDNLGRLTYQIDGELGLKKVEYDAVGNVIASSQFEKPLTTRTLLASNILTQLESIEGQAQQRTQTIYDVLNRPEYTISAEGYITQTVYDALSNVTDTYIYGAKVELDVDGNAKVENGVIEFVGQDLAGFENEIRHTQFEYNHRNQVTLETSPNGIQTKYKYDDLGNRTDIIEAKGLPEKRKTHFVYDAINRLTDQYQAYGTTDEVRTHFVLTDVGQISQKIEAYKTDVNGNPIELENSRITDYIYYDNNRLKMTTVKLNDTEQLDTYQQYDAAGNVLLAVSGVISITGDTYTANQNARTVTFDYDANNRLTDQFTTLVNAQTIDGELVEAVIRHDKHGYGALGNKVSSTNAVGTIETRTVNYSYDSDNRLELMIDGNGNKTQYIYDGVDNLISQTESFEAVNTEETKTIEYRYDLDNRRTDMIAAQKLLDDSGLFTIDNVTHYEYDAVGNLNDQYTGYNLPENVAEGLYTQRHTQFEFDLLNRQTQIISAEGNVIDFEYDDLNRQIAINSNVKTHAIIKDEYGVITDNGESQATQRFWYNKLDQNTFTLSAEGYLQAQLFNEFGQVTDSFQYKDKIDLTTISDYSTAPTPISIEDVIASNYEYDSGGRLTLMTDPIKTTAYEYNLHSDMVVQRDASGTVLERISTFDFDNAGRLTGQTIAIGVESVDGVVSKLAGETVLDDTDAITTRFELDSLGQTINRFDDVKIVNGVEAQSGVTHFDYDDNGNVINEISINVEYRSANGDPVFKDIGVTYNYGEDNLVNTMQKGEFILTDGVLELSNVIEIMTYTRDADGRVVVEEKGDDESQQISNFVYDSLGNVITKTSGNIVENYLYDLDGRQSQIINGSGDDVVVTQFEYDSSGNVSRKLVGNTPANVTDEESRLIESFIYDKAGRLSVHTNASNNTTSYQYDVFNNVILETNANNQITQRTFDDGSRLKVETISNKYQTTHEYDVLGRLLNIETAGLIAELDSNGNVQLDENENLITKEDQVQIQAFEYDLRGNRTKVIDNLGFGSVMNYNWQNQIETQRSGDYLLDIDLLDEAAATDIQNKIHVSELEYEYDSRGRKIQETYIHQNENNEQDNIINLFTYHSNDQLATTINGNGKASSSYEYGTSGKLVSQIENGIKTEFTYFVSGLLQDKSVINTDGQNEFSEQRTKYNYDTAGRIFEEIQYLELSTSSTVLSVTEYNYDEFGNVELIKVQGGTHSSQGIQKSGYIQQTKFEYNNENRVTLEQYRLKNPDTEDTDNPYIWIDKAGYQYDDIGNVISESTWVMTQDSTLENQEEAKTLKFYDELNRNVLNVSPEGYVTRNVYDSQGNMTDVLTAQQPLTGLNDSTDYTQSDVEGLIDESTIFTRKEFEFDDLNRQSAMISHYGNNQQIRNETTYDGSSNIITQTIAVGTLNEVTSFNVYDDQNRQTDSYIAFQTDDQVRTHYIYNALNQVIEQYDDYKLNAENEFIAGRVTLSEYNGRGQVTNIKVEVTDSKGNDDVNYTVNNFNSLGQLENTITGKYDDIENSKQEFGEITVANIRDGFITHYRYDLAGRLESEVKGFGEESTIQTFKYDFAGNKTRDILGSQVDNQVIVEYRYDLNNRMSQQIQYESGSQLITSYTYDNSGNTLSKIEGEQLEDKKQETSYRYDELGRVVYQKDAENYITTFDYDWMGNVVKETRHSIKESIQINDNNQFTRSYYNELGQLEIKLTAGNIKQVNTYDELGRILSTRTGDSEEILIDDALTSNIIDDERVTTYEYDLRGNKNKIIDPELFVTNIQYDWMGNQTQVISGTYEGSVPAKIAKEKEVILQFTYDEIGQMTSMSNFITSSLDDLSGTTEVVTEYYYDAMGNRVEVIEGILVDILDGQKSRDRDIETVHVDSVTYDATGRIKEERSTSGSYILNSYNSLGQLDVKTILRSGDIPAIGVDIYSDEYEDEGALKNVTNYFYNDRGLETSTIIVMGEDAQGNVVDNIEMHTVYDAFGNVEKSIKGVWFNNAGVMPEGQSQVVSFEYDSLNRKVLEIDGEGIETNFEYDSFSNNTKIEKEGAITYLIYNQSNQVAATIDPINSLYIYQYDSVGNIVKSEHMSDMLIYDFESDSVIKNSDIKDAILIAAAAGELKWNSEQNALEANTVVFDHDSMTVKKVTDNLFDRQDNNYQTIQISSGLFDTTTFTKVKEYDSQGNLISESELRNSAGISDVRSMDYIYDSIGRLELTADYQATQSSIVVDGEKLYSEGIISTYVYDIFNNKLIETIEIKGDAQELNPIKTTHYAYDKGNREIASSFDLDGLNLGQAYKYDNAGNKVGYFSAAVITSNDNGITHTEGSGNLITYSYYADGSIQLERQYVTIAQNDGLDGRDEVEYQFVGPASSFASPSEDNPNGESWTLNQIDLYKDDYDLVTLTNVDSGQTIEIEKVQLNDVDYWSVVEIATQIIDISYTYDNAGNLSTKIDPNANVYGYEYNGNGLLTRESLPTVSISTFNDAGEETSVPKTDLEIIHTYDALGNEIQTIDPSGFKITNWYDANGRMTAMLDANNVLTTYEYDGFNNKTVEHLFNGFQNESMHNIQANEINAVPQSVSSNIDPVTNEANSVDQLTTHFEYDSRDNLLVMRHPQTTVSTLYVDDNGVLVEVNEDTAKELLNGAITIEHEENALLTERFTYDIWDNQTSVTDKALNSVYQLYDINNRVVSQLDQEGFVTQFYYDSQDNVVKQQLFAQKYTGDITDPELIDGRLVITGQSEQIDKRYDSANRLIEERISTAETWSVTETQIGNTSNYSVEVLKDVNAQYVALFEYDESGNETKVTRGEAFDPTDPDKDLKQITEYKFYDEANRVILILNGDRVIQHQWDANSNLIKLSDFVSEGFIDPNIPIEIDSETSAGTGEIETPITDFTALEIASIISNANSGEVELDVDQFIALYRNKIANMTIPQIEEFMKELDREISITDIDLNIAKITGSDLIALYDNQNQAYEQIDTAREQIKLLPVEILALEGNGGEISGLEEIFNTKNEMFSGISNVLNSMPTSDGSEGQIFDFAFLNSDSNIDNSTITQEDFNRYDLTGDGQITGDDYALAYNEYNVAFNLLSEKQAELEQKNEKLSLAQTTLENSILTRDNLYSQINGLTGDGSTVEYDVNDAFIQKILSLNAEYRTLHQAFDDLVINTARSEAIPGEISDLKTARYNELETYIEANGTLIDDYIALELEIQTLQEDTDITEAEQVIIDGKIADKDLLDADESINYVTGKANKIELEGVVDQIQTKQDELDKLLNETIPQLTNANSNTANKNSYLSDVVSYKNAYTTNNTVQQLVNNDIVDLDSIMDLVKIEEIKLGNLFTKFGGSYSDLKTQWGDGALTDEYTNLSGSQVEYQGLTKFEKIQYILNRVGASFSEDKVTELTYNALNKVTQEQIIIGQRDSGLNELSDADIFTSYLYDARGNQVGERVHEFASIAYDTSYTSWSEFDGNNQVTKTIDAGGLITETAFDARGNTVQIYGHNLDQSIIQIQNLIFDDLGSLIETQKPDGTSEKYSVDALGNAIYTQSIGTDGLESIDSFSIFDSNSRMISQLSQLTEFDINGTGEFTDSITVSAQTQTVRSIMQTQYDEKGRVVKETYADNSTKETTYNHFDKVLTQTYRAEASGNNLGIILNSVKNYYDIYGNLLFTSGEKNTLQDDVQNSATTSGELSGLVKIYDDLGRVKAEYQGLAHDNYLQIGELVRSYQVDKFGRTVNQSEKINNNNAENPYQITQNQRTVYDQNDQIVQLVKGLKEHVQFSLDSRGNRVATFNNGGVSFLSVNQSAENAYALNGVVFQKFDETGNIVSTLTLNESGDADLANDYGFGDGQTKYLSESQFLSFKSQNPETTKWTNIDFEYDVFGRKVTDINAINQEKATQYDQYGRIETVTDQHSGVTTTFVYDSFGRTVQEYNNFVTTDNSSYALSGLTPVDPDHTGKNIYKTYDDQGMLTSVFDGTTRVHTVYTYDIKGQRITERLFNDYSEYSIEDGELVQSDIDHKVLQMMYYRYDEFGNQVQWDSLSYNGVASDYNLTISNANNDSIQVLDPTRLQSNWDFDRAGNLVAVRNFSDTDYDVNKPEDLNLTAIGQEYYGYDQYGRLEKVATDSVFSPESILVAYTYYSNGQYASTTKIDGDSTISKYLEYNEEGYVSFANWDLWEYSAWEYDHQGNMVLYKEYSDVTQKLFGENGEFTELLRELQAEVVNGIDAMVDAVKGFVSFVNSIKNNVVNGFKDAVFSHPLWKVVKTIAGFLGINLNRAVEGFVDKLLRITDQITGLLAVAAEKIGNGLKGYVNSLDPVLVDDLDKVEELFSRDFDSIIQDSLEAVVIGGVTLIENKVADAARYLQSKLPSFKTPWKTYRANLTGIVNLYKKHVSPLVKGFLKAAINLLVSDKLDSFVSGVISGPLNKIAELY